MFPGLIPDVTLSQVFLRIAASLLVIGFYGMVVVTFARFAGDKGPTFDGRSTANPLVHLDLLALLSAVLFRVVWIKHVDFDPQRFVRIPLAVIGVVLGSSLVTIVFGIACILLRSVVFATVAGDGAVIISSVLTASFEMSISIAFLNVLPVPPLVGILWVAAVSPSLNSAIRNHRTRLVGTLVVVAAVVSGIVPAATRAFSESILRVLGFG